MQITSKPQELEVQTQDGRWRRVRIVPYAIGPKTFSGTVVSFVDINLLKLAQESACEMQQLFADVVHSSPALVWLADTSKGCICGLTSPGWPLPDRPWNRNWVTAGQPESTLMILIVA